MPLLYESADGIATITINRPDKLNAINSEVCTALHAAWLRLEAGEDRVAILTGAGDAAFCAGIDVADPPTEFRRCVPGLDVRLSKPVIVALSGWCVGGAVVITMMADLAVASESTRFVYPEAKLGVFGGVMAGAVSRMPHKVAMELMLLGQELSVARAYEVGFVNLVVPVGQQLVAARGFARHIAKGAPLVLQAMKAFAAETLPRGPMELGSNDERLARIRQSEDRQEGAAARREKREPQFKGR